MAEMGEGSSGSGQTGEDEASMPWSSLDPTGSSADSPLADDECSQPGPSGRKKPRKMMNIREALIRSGAYRARVRGNAEEKSESSYESRRKIPRLDEASDIGGSGDQGLELDGDGGGGGGGGGSDGSHGAGGGGEDPFVNPEARYDVPNPGADLLLEQNEETGLTRWYPQDPYSLLSDDRDEIDYKVIGELYNTVHIDQYFRSRMQGDFVKTYLNRGGREGNFKGYFFRTRSDQQPMHNKYGNVSYVISFMSMLEFCVSNGLRAFNFLDVCQTKDECKARYLITDRAQKLFEHQWEYNSLIYGGAWYAIQTRIAVEHKYASYIREFRKVRDYSTPNELEFFVAIREELSQQLFASVRIEAEDHSEANNEDNCYRYRTGQSDDWTVCPYPYTKFGCLREIRSSI
ncbi:uncharacterized protein LOC135198589 isoform X2 [Macrobrachium nipponense]|uniref:uncharacterized protein LOC135198589 isoform X2 n=1 Tax=Macrobrachium nipponense TaxID=159736 RepID=UPI0030C83473